MIVPMTDLATIAPAFVEMAHQIVWCSAATVDAKRRPRSRVLHPIWEWDGAELTGWIATDPTSPKRAHLDRDPYVSCNYWAPSQDTCLAECGVEWALDEESCIAVWNRFPNGPAPVGYDPSIIPQWDSPQSPHFGALKLTPWHVRVLPGSVMMSGGAVGELLTWKRS
jgi:hypothetical protein